MVAFAPLVGWIFLIFNFKSSTLPPLEGRCPDGRRGEMNRFNQYKVFDISKSRPQVLLLGNGLFRNKDNPSWTELILKLANLENSSMEDKLFFSQIKNDAPYSILAGSVLPDDHMERRKAYSCDINELDLNDDNRMYIDKMLNIPFDAVLTTNYTYEIENHILRAYKEMPIEKKLAYACRTSNSKSRKPFRTFNRFPNGDSNVDIWHIHGETRLKQSIVMTHDEYIRNTTNIVKYVSGRRNEYQNHYNELKFMSWIDYLIMGDVYVLGQGFDFSELDLWWLIHRRLTEKAKVGTINFYEPMDSHGVMSSSACVLQHAGAKCHSLGVRLADGIAFANDNNKAYSQFYVKSLDHIKEKVLEYKNEKTIRTFGNN